MRSSLERVLVCQQKALCGENSCEVRVKAADESLGIFNYSGAPLVNMIFIILCFCLCCRDIHTQT